MDIQAEYLMQYYLTSIPNPSDDSDFDENSYDLEEEIKISKLKRIATEMNKQNKRKQTAKLYVEKWQFSKVSIFNLPGIKITHYNHKFIRMLFKSAQFSNFSKKTCGEVITKNYICSHRIYQVTLIYKMKYNRWILGKNEVPCKDEIINLFKHNIYDEHLKVIICSIYEILTKYTKNLALERQNRKKAFLAGEDIILTPDEEILFLTKEKIENKHKKENEIWQRLLLPEHLRFDNQNNKSPRTDSNSSCTLNSKEIENSTEITETVSGTNSKIKEYNLRHRSNYIPESSNNQIIVENSVTSKENNSLSYNSSYNSSDES